MARCVVIKRRMKCCVYGYAQQAYICICTETYTFENDPIALGDTHTHTRTHTQTYINRLTYIHVYPYALFITSRTRRPHHEQVRE
jgi:hypothetical protein